MSVNIYEDKLKEILNSHMVTWEETSYPFNMLISFLLSKRGKCIFLYRDLDHITLCTYLRYLAEMEVEVIEAIHISDTGKITIEKLNELLKNKETVTFLRPYSERFRKWYHEIRITTGIKKNFDHTILAKQLWNTATPVMLPFVRKRGEEIRLCLEENYSDFLWLISRLDDETSRDVLLEILRTAVANDIYRLAEGSQYAKYWECYHHREDEVWVNCGSASGDTILKFLRNSYSFEKIYAFEGNPQEYMCLTKILDKLPEKYSAKIESINKYIGLEKNENNFNNKFSGKKVTLINMDIEGAEMSVLRGADEIILSQRPVIAVCAYHNASDLLDIPHFIDGVTDNYRIFLRKYRGYEPNALNEYLFYLVPGERTL